jgi:hypothetical protein
MKKIVNVKIQPEYYSKLKHISFDRLVTVTSIIEKLIYDYVDSYNKNIEIKLDKEN